jgi:hypothetical protein
VGILEKSAPKQSKRGTYFGNALLQGYYTKSMPNPPKKSFFPRYLKGKLRGENEKTMQGILEKWNAHSYVMFHSLECPTNFLSSVM